MNRQERRGRAAEARHIKPKSDEGNMLVGSRSAVPDDIKADICRAVLAIRFSGLDGGMCLFRAYVGFLTLDRLGWQPTISCGAMLYRAGADPIRDVLAFCGPHNAGQLLDGHFLGHIWLEMDGELIDFSCGDWPHLDPRAELIGGLPPIRWQSPPPTFIWATRALFPWKSFGEPNTGEMWYGPWTGTPPDVADTLDMLIKNTAIVRAVEKNLALAKLPERVAASRR